MTNPRVQQRTTPFWQWDAGPRITRTSLLLMASGLWIGLLMIGLLLTLG